MFFIAYTFRTSACVCRTSENCKSIVLQDKCNIEIFLSPECNELVFQDTQKKHVLTDGKEKNHDLCPHNFGNLHLCNLQVEIINYKVMDSKLSINLLSYD